MARGRTLLFISLISIITPSIHVHSGTHVVPASLEYSVIIPLHSLSWHCSQGGSCTHWSRLGQRGQYHNTTVAATCISMGHLITLAAFIAIYNVLMCASSSCLLQGDSPFLMTDYTSLDMYLIHMYMYMYWACTELSVVWGCREKPYIGRCTRLS